MPKRLLLLLLLLSAAPAFGLDGELIMDSNFNAGKAENWQAQSRMTLVDNAGHERIRTGELSNRLQSDGDHYDRLYRYFSPQDIRGTAVLVLEHSGDDDMWIYLPALHKSRRISARNKRDSFVGSDFSYGDVASPKIEDFTHTLLGKEILDGMECYKVESHAKTDRITSDTGYSKKVSWIRTDNFMEKRIDYFDETGDLLKTQLISDLFPADPKAGKWLALRREMQNHRTDHRTIILFDKVDTERRFPAQWFSVRSLKKGE